MARAYVVKPQCRALSLLNNLRYLDSNSSACYFVHSTLALYNVRA